MEQYSVQEAQAYLEELVAEAQGGKTVLIVDQYGQAVQLVPVSMSSKRHKAGSAKGKISIVTDFDSPLADFNDYTE